MLRMTTLNGFNEALNVLLQWLGYTSIFSLHWPSTLTASTLLPSVLWIVYVKVKVGMIEYSVVSAFTVVLFCLLLKLVRCRYQCSDSPRFSLAACGLVQCFCFCFCFQCNVIKVFCNNVNWVNSCVLIPLDCCRDESIDKLKWRNM